MQPLKAISFLGVNQKGYTKTRYYTCNTEEKSCETEFFQEALVNIYKPETLYVFLTESAETHIPNNMEQSTWETLKSRLSERVKIEPVLKVPEGNDSKSIWTIFDQITNCLEKGDRVVFDITHAFRSIPIIALVAVSYLRVVRQVTIEGLIYGQFMPNSPENSPIYDLLPIVSLLEWTTATDQFIKTGNAQALAQLLSDKNDAIQGLANNIKAISNGLELLRPVDVMTESAHLKNTIKLASEHISESVPPFVTLLNRIDQDYGKFSLENSTDFKNNAKISLINQLKMIKWYVDKGQVVHALSLAREWLPSLLCWHFELDPFNESDRNEMELLLVGGTIKNKESNSVKESKYLKQWKEFPKDKRKQLTNIWNDEFRLANLRNDVLHSGFRKNPKKAEDIILQTQRILEALKLIAKEWGLQE